MSNVIAMQRPVDRKMAERALDRLSKALALYENEVEAENKLPEELGEDIGGLMWAAEVMLQAALGPVDPVVGRAAEVLMSQPET